MQALQDYKLKNMALDQAAARRARIAQVQRFYEDVNSVLDAPVGAKALWDVDQPIAQRLHDLRQGIRSQLDSGTLTSHTPGAADQLEHVQNRITQGMEIAASRAGSRAPATADLLRRGVQSYLANLPRNRLQNYPR